MMKTHAPARKSIFLYILLIAFVAASCGSFQQTAYYSDGVYDNNADYRQNTTVVQQTVNTSSQNYENYFAYKSQEYETLTDQQGDVFTDVDSYSSAPDENNIETDGDYDYQGNGYAGWGDGGVTNVYINIVPNYNWGWNNSYWNTGYWNTGYWRSGGFYGPSSWGWNNTGYYNSFWGANYWGWNGSYGASWGYGNSWAGGYGFCPSSYSNYVNSSNTYVANNSRRGLYNTTSRRQNTSSINDYTSRRGYTGNNSYSGSDQISSRTQSRRTKTKKQQNYSVKRSNAVKNSTSKRNTSKNYSTRNNNSSYNNKSSSRKNSSGSYRSSSPSRSSGSSARSKSSSSSRSSGSKRGGRG